MPTLTQRLRLKKHTTGDTYRIQDYTDNWNILDANPGTFLCTEATFPTSWDGADAGRLIHETDTGLLWRWNGTEAVRVFPVGDLGLTELTAPSPGTSSTTPQVALSLEVDVPRGGRSVLVNVNGPGVYSTNGLARLALFRDSTQIQSWLSHGRLSGDATDQPRPISMAVRDTPSAGTVTYTFRYAAETGYAGTVTLQGALDQPLQLSVVEV